MRMPSLQSPCFSKWSLHAAKAALFSSSQRLRRSSASRAFRPSSRVCDRFTPRSRAWARRSMLIETLVARFGAETSYAACVRLTTCEVLCGAIGRLAGVVAVIRADLTMALPLSVMHTVYAHCSCASIKRSRQTARDRSACGGFHWCPRRCRRAWHRAAGVRPDNR